MKIKMKMKRKTKIVMLSTVFLCLFMISFSVNNVSAADDPTMTVDFNSSYIPPTDFPIKIDVNFVWDLDGVNRQKLYSVHVYYSINKLLVGEDTYVGYERIYTDPFRPEIMTFIIPSDNLVSRDNLRFKVDVVWKNYIGKESSLSDGPHLIKILTEAGEGELQLGLTIGISVGSFVAVLIVFLYFWRRRRR